MLKRTLCLVLAIAMLAWAPIMIIGCEENTYDVKRTKTVEDQPQGDQKPVVK